MKTLNIELGTGCLTLISNFVCLYPARQTMSICILAQMISEELATIVS